MKTYFNRILRVKKRHIQAGFLLLIVHLFAGYAFTQQAGSNLYVSPGEDYLIGPRDVIDVKVEDAPEISGTFQLNSKGTFTLPVVGQVIADQKTAELVAKTIADKLRGGYLMNPLVTVSVKQSNSRAFFIQGSVRQPGIYQVEGHPSLLKLITIAGGLTDNYGSTAYILKARKPAAGEVVSITDVPDNQAVSGTNTEVSLNKTNSTATQPENTSEDDTEDPDKDDKYEVVKANISNLLRGNLDQNLRLNPGDIIHIPQSDIFFVSGEVKAPGDFPLKNGTTLRQAIALAQGTTFQSNLDRSIIFRVNQTTGKREEVPVNIAAIMSGKQADIDIQPNDVIMVPNNQKKAFAKQVLKPLTNSIPGLLLRGLGIW